MIMKDFGAFQTQSESLIHVIKMAEKLALTTSPICIFGEEGTGRRSLAKWIQVHSGAGTQLHVWNEYEFQIENCKPGDSILIENLSDLGPSALFKLRSGLLQNSVLASSKLRLISTSGTSPSEWMESSAMARELVYRLCVATLEMPSLRARGADLLYLAHFFLQVSCFSNGLSEKHFSENALLAIQRHSWPGNVAELANVVERAVLSADAGLIEPGHLSFFKKEDTLETATESSQQGLSLFEMERRLIFQTLELTRHNKTRAAQILGISIRTLRNKLHGYRQEMEAV